MVSMTEIICACGCGNKKKVRTADIKRGWGKFYSKSCKAIYQERKTHQCAKFYDRQHNGHLNLLDRKTTLIGNEDYEWNDWSESDYHNK